MPALMRGNELVLGLAGSVDYEVSWDAGVLEDLVRRYRIRREELVLDRPIDSERDLVATILAFLAQGAGGERYVGSLAIIEEFAARCTTRVTLGGTPVRAALAMRALGVTCRLHLVAVDDHVRRLLPADCSYICSAREDSSTHPHLIVQFPAGARVRAGDIDLAAPHPDRLIFANDPPAMELMLSEDLGEALAAAEVFLVSGFNVIQDPKVLAQRLADLHRHMTSLRSGALVFYEDAGFHAPGLGRQVREALRGVVDVHSMNEDEMRGYLGHCVDLLDPDQVERALRELSASLTGPTLVVHTKYWALAVGRDAQAHAAALRGGMTMATTRYWHGDQFTEADYEAVGGLLAHPDGVHVADALGERLGHAVCCIPAIRVDVPEPTTVGLGDAFVGGFIAALARAPEPPL
jgi:ADP-dependent phosphofructokinase/glucokinase